MKHVLLGLVLLASLINESQAGSDPVEAAFVQGR